MAGTARAGEHGLIRERVAWLAMASEHTTVGRGGSLVGVGGGGPQLGQCSPTASEVTGEDGLYGHSMGEEEAKHNKNESLFLCN
jgi:hypothetical protein